jgi:hypothetical protein
MSERTHFWIRVAAVAVILAAEFGPRLTASAKSASRPAIATVAVVR